MLVFVDFDGEVETLKLPEFKHVLQLDCPSHIGYLYPSTVHIPGSAPLQYVLRVLNSIQTANKEKPKETGNADVMYIKLLHPKSLFSSIWKRKCYQ